MCSSRRCGTENATLFGSLLRRYSRLPYGCGRKKVGQEHVGALWNVLEASTGIACYIQEADGRHGEERDSSPHKAAISSRMVLIGSPSIFGVRPQYLRTSGMHSANYCRSTVRLSLLLILALPLSCAAFTLRMGEENIIGVYRLFSCRLFRSKLLQIFRAYQGGR